MKRWHIVTIIILLLAGGSSFYFWHKHNQNSNSNNQASSQNQSGYLVIKEWGVRMKTNEKIQGTYYWYDRKYDAVNLMVDSVKQISGCEDATRLQTIERAKKGQPLGPTVASDQGLPQMIKIKDYYYLPTGPAHNCGQPYGQPPPPPVGAVKVQTIDDGYQEAFQTLEAVPN